MVDRVLVEARQPACDHESCENRERAREPRERGGSTACRRRGKSTFAKRHAETLAA